MAKRKNGRFSVIPTGTRSLFDGLDGPTKFRWPRSKIKGDFNNNRGLSRNGESPARTVTKISISEKNGICAKKLHFWPIFCIFLRFTYETPIFLAQTDPTHLDHKSPISWGNSGYLRVSGRWPFGRSAGCFTATIAQSGPVWAQKQCYLPEINFWCTSSNFFVTIMRH